MDHSCLHDTKTNIQTVCTIKEEPDEPADSDKSKCPLLDPGPLNSYLYDDHQVKDEVVLGPTVLYKPILNFDADIPHQPTKKLKDCLVFDDEDDDKENLFNVYKKPHTKPDIFDDDDKENSSFFVNAEKKPIKENNDRNPVTKPIYDKKVFKTPFVCNYCQKTYKYIGNIKKHLKEHLKSEMGNNIDQNKSAKEKTAKCNICCKSFTNKYNMKKHYNEFHDRENNTFKCDLCHKIFRRKDAIAIHIRTVHSDRKKSFTCKCGKSFFDMQSRKKHIKKCKYDKAKEALNCEICHKTLSNLQLLKRHINYHKRKIREKEQKKVGGEKKYNIRSTFYCDFCNKSFDNKERIIGHINKNHMAVPLLHTCEICDKSYALKKTFDKHLMTHTGTVEEFNCKHCKRTFRSKWGHRLHERECLSNMNKPKVGRKKICLKDT